jgi:hypothetical protein
MLDVTDQINDPKQNVIDQSFSGSTGMLMAYGQSFLREEVGKMYRGELILRGIAEIEPMDVLLIMDPSTGMLGPIEVETVTRSLPPAAQQQLHASAQDGFDSKSRPHTAARTLPAIGFGAGSSFLPATQPHPPSGPLRGCSIRPFQGLRKSP